MNAGKKGQSSVETLLLLTIVFTGMLFVFSIYLNTSDSTTALEIARLAVIEKLSGKKEFFHIDSITFSETEGANGKEITVNVKIIPETHLLNSGSFAEASSLIAEKTRYEKAVIRPVCGTQACP